MKTFNFAIVIVAFYINGVISQIFPTNPCPNLFRYFENSNGEIFGRLEYPNDYSGEYRLTVNMSVATLLSNDKNIRLELKTSIDNLSEGGNVIYDIYFPIQSVLPKPTRIEFNNRVYCSGPSEEVRPGRGVTNMWATTYQAVYIPFRPNRPTTNPSDNFPDNPFPDASTFRSVPATTRTPRTTTTRRTTTTTTTTTRRPATRTTTTTTRRPTRRTTTTPTTTITTASTPSVQQCGSSSVNTQQLIVNGDAVEEGQFPWMAAIMYRQGFNYNYGCTGTLVTNRHVITAAHCVQFVKAPLVPIEDLLIVFGKTSIRNWANEAVLRDVQNFTAHPDYQEKKGDGDIAVLTLKKAVQFQTLIQPACLWQEDDDLSAIVGNRGTVAGWGRDETGKNFVAEAKKTNLPIVAQTTCLRSDLGFREITSNRTFCAGNLDGSGPCSGDSGAGFVMRIDGKWTLRGVVSTALSDTGTCDLTKYTVFADVPKFRDWIRNALM